MKKVKNEPLGDPIGHHKAQELFPKLEKELLTTSRTNRITKSF